MAFKIAFVVFTSALLVQAAQSCGCNNGCSGNIVGGGYLGNNVGGCSGCSGNIGGGSVLSSYGGSLGGSYGGSYGGYSGSTGSYGIGGGVAVASGGGLPVTISSPLSPSGISLRSENSIDGALDVCGALPVLAGVGIECSLPTSGSAGVQYGCGDGNIGITSNCGAYGFGSGYGAGNAGGYGGSAGGYGGVSGGWTGGRGCGCGC